MDNNDKNKMKGTKEILELLGKLTELQASDSILTAKIFIKEGKENVEKKVESLKQSILVQAKGYGQKLDKVVEQYNLNSMEENTILGEYKKALDEINKRYETPLKNAMIEKEYWQNMEENNIATQSFFQDRVNDVKKSDGYREYMSKQEKLKKEIKVANAKGDMDTVQEKSEEYKRMQKDSKENPAYFYESKIEPIKNELKELEEVIKLCDEELKGITFFRDAEIEKIELDKNNKMLALAKKQSPAQKFIFGILNKVNGAKKFKDNVIGKINENMETLKTEVIPNVEKKVIDKCVEFSSNMKKKREEFKQEREESREEFKEETKELIEDISNIAKEKIMSGKTKVEEGVTKVKDTVVEGVTKASEGVTKVKDSVVEGVSNVVNNTKDIVQQQVINRGKQTFNSIIMKGRTAKINTLQKINTAIQNSIDKSIEKNSKLMENNNILAEGR